MNRTAVERDQSGLGREIIEEMRKNKRYNE